MMYLFEYEIYLKCMFQEISSDKSYCLFIMCFCYEDFLKGTKLNKYVFCPHTFKVLLLDTYALIWKCDFK